MIYDGRLIHAINTIVNISELCAFYHLFDPNDYNKQTKNSARY